MPSTGNTYFVNRLHDHEDRIEPLEDAGVGTPMTGSIDMGINSIINLAPAVNDNDSVSLVTLNNGLNTKLSLDGSNQMSDNFNTNGNRVYN